MPLLAKVLTVMTVIWGARRKWFPIVKKLWQSRPMRNKTCACCTAKNETIAVLKDEVEWLRLHSGTPYTTRTQPINPTEQPDVIPGMPLYLSEEEEEERAREMAEELLRHIGADPNVAIE